MKPVVITATRQPMSNKLTRATASRPVSRLVVSDDNC